MKKQFNNLKPTGKSTKSTKKVSDEKIDAVLNELESKPAKKKATMTKQKPIAFNIKLPENLYNALDNESKATGLTKKAIVVAALWERLGR